MTRLYSARTMNGISTIAALYWWWILVSSTQAATFRADSVAAIFGIGGGKQAESQAGVATKQQQQPPPPARGNSNELYPPPPRPPPPPPKTIFSDVSASSKDPLTQQLHQQQQQHQQRDETLRPENDNMYASQGGWVDTSLPPPPGFLGPPSPDGWRMGPPPPFWSQQPPGSSSNNQQYPPDNMMMIPPEALVPLLQQDLDQSMRREHELQECLSNVSEQVMHYKQREELHLRQLDVLTERVMETEATSAHERNLLIQSQANCTALGEQVAALEGHLEEWKARCAEHAVRIEESLVQITGLKKDFKHMSRKAEELAALIEKHGLEKDAQLVIPVSKRGKNKKRGFWAWLFGWGNEEEDEDDDFEQAQKAARSTLLEALQRERNNVDELETTVAFLQQNNTAMAEQVHSRDSIIAELNDRVAVFEEDRVVLKAALRQLQKEMNEEAPKTKKLIEDLRQARKEIDRLNREMKTLVANHQEEITELQRVLKDREEAIRESESNLTMIAAYVDRLETRLGDFALAKRDITEREQRYLESERIATEMQKEKEKLGARVKELEKEQDELKKLFEELIHARTNLQNDCNKLKQQREQLLLDRTQLQQSLDGLNKQMEGLRQDNEFWQTRALQTEQELNATKEDRAQLAIQSLDTSFVDALKRQLDEITESKRQLEILVRDIEASRLELKKKVASLEQMHQTSESDRRSVREELEHKKVELLVVQNAMKALEQEFNATLKLLQEEAQAKKIQDAKRSETPVQVQVQGKPEVESVERTGPVGVAGQALSGSANDGKQSSVETTAGDSSAVNETTPEKNTSSSSSRTDGSAEKQDETIKVSLNISLASGGTSSPAFGKSEADRVPPAHKVEVKPSNVEELTPKKGMGPTSSKDIVSDPSSATQLEKNTSHPPKGREPARQDIGAAGIVTHGVELGDKQPIDATNRTDSRDKVETLLNRTQPPILSQSNGSNASRIPRSKREIVQRKDGVKERKVFLRSVRKVFSKVTGIHGLITAPSHPHGRKENTKNAQKRQLPSTAKGTSPAGSTIAARPDVIKHTFGGIRFPQRTPEPKS